MRMILPALILLATGAAAAQPLPPPPTGPTAAPNEGFGRLRFHGTVFLSPMGEPFRSETPGADSVETWFRQADRDGDGYLTSAEMQADALRFFATLDTNHDGELDPDEVARYENEVAPEVQLGLQMRGSGGGRFGGGGISGRGHGGMGRGGGRGGMGRGGGQGGMGGGGGMAGEAGRPAGGEFELGLEGAGRFSFLNIPEPVISADVDLNRGVSRQEFIDAAGQRFAMLDTNHHGRIARAELPPLPQRHTGKRKKKKGDPRERPEEGRQGI